MGYTLQYQRLVAFKRYNGASTVSVRSLLCRVRRSCVLCVCDRATRMHEGGFRISVSAALDWLLVCNSCNKRNTAHKLEQ
jgi:hypothetical protein